MIGIIDYDLLTAKKGAPPPSLSAMKFSSYLKSTESEQVRLLDNLKQAEACSKVIFTSEKPLDKIEKAAFLLENCEYYGKYLADEIPRIVEHMSPDVTLYNELIQERVVKRAISAAAAFSFLDSIYYQAYGKNGERLPLPPSATRKRFYLYDDDLLSHEECWEILDSIIERAPTAIYFTESIKCHTIKQFLTLREDYEKVSRANKIILDYFVPLHHFDVYFGKYKLKLLGEIAKNSDVNIYIGKNYNNNAYNDVFYIKNLYYCLNLVFSYYSRNIPIKVEIYTKPSEINPYIYFYKLIRSWVNNKDPDATLEDAINSSQVRTKIEELLKKHSIFDIFLHKSKNDLIKTRGVWRAP